MLPSFFRFTADLFPPSFLCAACRLPTWKTICDPCKQSLHFNQEILPPPFPGVEGAAPLLYSFHRTQSLIRHWKEHQGSDVRRALFRMPISLQNQLCEKHFFAVVPIPQDLGRAEKRGHQSAHEVARFFSRKIKVPILELLQLKEKITARVAGLSRFEREFAPNPFCIHRGFPEPGYLSQELERKVFQGKEIRILLIDDLMTSGSTLSKAQSTLHELLPRARIWVGGIGIRPNVLKETKSARLYHFPNFPNLHSLSYPGTPPLQSESAHQWPEEPS